MKPLGFAHEISPKDKRQGKWHRQRLFRGFDDTETWNLDNTTAKFLVPRLIRFKKITNGYPGAFNSKNGFRKWKKIINKMVRAFELLSGDNCYSGSNRKEIEEGLDLFAKYYRNLWW